MAKKVQHVLVGTRLGAVLCVGETLAERKAGKQLEVIKAQLEPVRQALLHKSSCLKGVEKSFNTGIEWAFLSLYPYTANEYIYAWNAAFCFFGEKNQ